MRSWDGVPTREDDECRGSRVNGEDGRPATDEGGGRSWETGGPTRSLWSGSTRRPATSIDRTWEGRDLWRPKAGSPPTTVGRRRTSTVRLTIEPAEGIGVCDVVDSDWSKLFGFSGIRTHTLRLDSKFTGIRGIRRGYRGIHGDTGDGFLDFFLIFQNFFFTLFISITFSWSK